MEPEVLDVLAVDVLDDGEDEDEVDEEMLDDEPVSLLEEDPLLSVR